MNFAEPTSSAAFCCRALYPEVSAVPTAATTDGSTPM